jgi:hypothetical protein
MSTKTNAHNFNGCPMISKGTLVRVRTTNGGDGIAELLENHRPTYDVVIDMRGPVIIPASRIVSVEIIPRGAYFLDEVN